FKESAPSRNSAATEPEDHEDRMRSSTCRTLLAAGIVALTAACSADVDSNGYVFRDGDITDIRPGAQTKEGVLQALGTPSSRAPFDDNVWYYIGERNQQVAFFDPELIDRQVLVVRFDDTGFVESTEVLTKEDGNQVALVNRETPTAGHELTFLEQLLGNIGRFNRDTAGGN